MNSADTKSGRIRPFGTDALEEAVALILRGLPVAVATETVYGLAADATDGEAVARIYAAKGRPSFNPLIVHVPDIRAAASIAQFDDCARDLAARFWPGPLTLVLPLLPGASIASIVVAGLPTVALRVPAHPAMQALLAGCGRPLAAPSANASGRISPTRAEHVAASLGQHVPLILDSGPTRHGIESTIVGVDGGRARLLRPGPIDPATLGIPLDPARPGIEAPGQMLSHYAPAKPLRLGATSAGEGEWLIGFGAIVGDATLSTTGDLIEAAANLFDRLHDAERRSCRAIAVAPIVEHGLGAAINDRLARAAAPTNDSDPNS